jgi:hypothetical protein
MVPLYAARIEDLARLSRIRYQLVSDRDLRVGITPWASGSANGRYIALPNRSKLPSIDSGRAIIGCLKKL